jgi:hypothetical protein
MAEDNNQSFEELVGTEYKEPEQKTEAQQTWTYRDALGNQVRKNIDAIIGWTV